jgi:hypothetical protein
VIHLWVVNADATAEAGLKQIRKLAMTGGVDVALPELLSEDEVMRIVTAWTPELQRYAEGTSAYRSSTAYRILDLVSQNASYLKVALGVSGFHKFVDSKRDLSKE